jgi:predicted methyltransferase
MIELINDDCLNYLPKINNASVDFICVDLPYGTTSIEWDNVIPMEKLWPEYWRILKPNGVVCLFGSQPFSSYLINSALKEFKYELECIINQIVDKDEITLELHGNEILVDDVPIDSDIIEKALEDVLETLVADFEEQEEKRTFTS